MAAVQVLVNTFKGLQPLCLQFPPSPTEGELCNSIPTVADLKQRLTESHFPCLLPSDQLFTTLGGRLVPDSYPLYSPQNGSHPAEFNLLLRLPGGKGGFGSMLRAQGGKMASQKTTNFEACRDLQGRRLKTVNDAKRLADYLEKEPERKRQRQDKIKEKIEAGLKGPEKPKIRYHDPEFVKDHVQALDDVMSAVERAMAGPSQIPSPQPTSDSEEDEESDPSGSESVTKTPISQLGASSSTTTTTLTTLKTVTTRIPSPPAVPPKDLAQWDVVSDNDDADDDDEEEEEEEEEESFASVAGKGKAVAT